MAVRGDIKADLQAAGLWKDFYRRRDELKGLGQRPSEARDNALAELEPVFAVWRRSQESPEVEAAGPSLTERPRIPRRGAAPSYADFQSSSCGPGVSEAACCPAEGPLATSFRSVAGFDGLTEEEYEEFIRREVDIVEQYVWVCKHLDVPLGRLGILKAPCAQAWSLLLDARRNGARKSEFLDKSYSKLLPNRANIEGGLKLDADGSHIVGAIDRLLAIRKVVEEGFGDGGGSGAKAGG
jgi:hypothetical protein